LKDKALSFSYKKPFEFISEKNIKNIVVWEEGNSYSNDAEGIRENFLPLFANQGVCRGWRRLSNYVRNFAKSNYIIFSCE